MSGEDLEARISKQWQEIGFQGNNPATDFRGMGMLGLNCLLYPKRVIGMVHQISSAVCHWTLYLSLDYNYVDRYFSDEHRDRARSLLLHSKHPQYWYID